MMNTHLALLHYFYRHLLSLRSGLVVLPAWHRYGHNGSQHLEETRQFLSLPPEELGKFDLFKNNDNLLSSIAEGNVLRTPMGIDIKIIGRLGESWKSHVFVVKNLADKQDLTLKILRKNEPRFIRIIANERMAMYFLRNDIGLPVPKIIENGHNFTLQQYIPGTTAEDMVRTDNGYKKNIVHFPKAEQVIDILRDIVKSGIAIADMRPSNFIYGDNGKWYILDCGSLTQKKSKGSLLIRYERRFFKSWLQLEKPPILFVIWRIYYHIISNILLGGRAVTPRQ